MSIDIYVNSLRSAISKAPKFEMVGTYDLSCMQTSFPSWRAVFSGLVQWGYVTGSQIPSVEMFISSYIKAIKKHPHFNKYWSKWFVNNEPSDAMKYRLYSWYETGIAELYLYAALVEAIEDRLVAGWVVYDPRLDWKHKCDLLVLCRNMQFKINSAWGSADSVAFDVVKGVDSSKLFQCNEIKIIRNEDRNEVINGYRLFSQQDIDDVLNTIYDIAGLDESLNNGEKLPTIKSMIKEDPHGRSYAMADSPY